MINKHKCKFSLTANKSICDPSHQNRAPVGCMFFKILVHLFGKNRQNKEKLISIFDHKIAIQHSIYTLEVLSFSWQNALSNKEYKRFLFVSDKCPVLQCRVTYAPDTADSDTMVEDFYDVLQHAINNKPASDILVLMGDFNAKAGAEYQKWGGVLRKFGIAECNEWSEKLLNLYATDGLFLSNTCFKQSKVSREWTWESQNGAYHNKIYYIIINRKMRSSITDARSFTSADVGSDHQLVLANIKLKQKAKKRSTRQIKNKMCLNLYHEKPNSSLNTTIGWKIEAHLHDPETYLVVEGAWTKISYHFRGSSWSTA